jgi:hypothetical protein
MPAEFAVLSDPSHLLPWPGNPSRLFAAAGEMIDTDDPFWIGALADGSVRIAPLPAPPAPARASAASKSSEG